MKFGQVLAQERQRKNISIADAAQQLGLSLADYETLEAGKNNGVETAAALVVAFNDLVEGQVNQLYYPCGLPFTNVRSYNVT